MPLIMKFSQWHKEVIRSIGFMDRTGCLNTWLLRALFAIWVLASAGLPLRAQLVNDGATVTLANVTNNLSGSVTVGTNGSFTRLTISDNALLSNSAFGVIGRNASAHSNEVQLGSTSARWQMGSDLFVGSNGAGNRLVVSDGAFLNNRSGLIGYGAASSNNVALITGSGSFWTNRSDLTVGFSGRDNQMIVSNGARVVSFGGNLGSQPGSSNNLVLVTGSGSVWTNVLAGWVSVGAGERGNRLIIEDGGQVAADNGVVGAGVFGGDSEALVTGPGSIWSSRTDLAVGLNPSNNRLVVSNGAALVAAGKGRLGAVTGATNNVVLVTGAGSLWINRSELYVGEAGPRNRMEVRDGGRVVSSNTYVGYFGAGNVALVTGAGSTWSNLAGMFVGHSSRANQFVVGNAGTVYAGGDAAIGFDSAAVSNSILVTDAGSTCLVASNLYVGSTGAFNRLIIQGGAAVAIGNDGVVGNSANARSNAVVVTGPSSRWLVNSGLRVGSKGGFNQMVISNGGFVGDSIGLIGHNAAADQNSVVVTGSGSVWSNTFVVVGGASSGNQMIVTNGGKAFSSSGGYIGSDPGGEGNLARITGAGSAWAVGTTLHVGFSGNANRLVVENGGGVASHSGMVGLDALNNQALVTGAGSLWSNRLDLSVGFNGAANQMFVSNGGSIVASNVIVGVFPASTNNRVEVNGGTLRVPNPDSDGVLDVRRGTNVLRAGLVDVNTLLLTNAGIPVLHVLENLSNIRITNASAIPPYPSSIQVTGVSGIVTNLTVTLPSLSHFAPVNLRLLLVGPNGQAVMLMSGAGGGSNSSISNVQLTFADAAASRLPQLGKITSGTYRPSDYGFEFPMPTPAPPEPYSSTLSTFNNASPNGRWSLYIYSRLGNPSQELRGWSLRIRTDEPLPNPAVFEFNGGTLTTRGAGITNDLPFVVGGPGGVPAVWDVRPGGVHRSARNVIVGRDTPSNQLLIRPGADFSTDSDFIVGENPGLSPDNLLHVTGGTLRAVNSSRGTLDVRGGTNRIDAGLVDVNRLVVTNTRGQFEMFGGTFRSPSTTVANGRVCVIGGGPSLATYQMLGGTHTFANNLTIATNGSLLGTATIDGTVTVSAGGRLTPGSPIGRMDVLGSVILQGAVNLQIDKSGGVRTNDLVSASGAIFYGGTLKVTDIGTDVLSAGDRFFLFNATPYIGAFTTLNLPLLASGLSWRNNLAVDGSIEVTTAVVSTPGFSAINRTGTNIVFTGTNGTPNANFGLLTATNVALPSSNWVVVLTNHFDAFGRFQITNPVTPADRQRYFQLLTP